MPLCHVVMMSSTSAARKASDGWMMRADTTLLTNGRIGGLLCGAFYYDVVESHTFACLCKISKDLKFGHARKDSSNLTFCCISELQSAVHRITLPVLIGSYRDRNRFF